MRFLSFAHSHHPLHILNTTTLARYQEKKETVYNSIQTNQTPKQINKTTSFYEASQHICLSETKHHHHNQSNHTPLKGPSNTSNDTLRHHNIHNRNPLGHRNLPLHYTTRILLLHALLPLISLRHLPPDLPTPIPNHQSNHAPANGIHHSLRMAHTFHALC